MQCYVEVLLFLYRQCCSTHTDKTEQEWLNSWKFKVHHVYHKKMQTLDSLQLVCTCMYVHGFQLWCSDVFNRLAVTAINVYNLSRSLGQE